MKYEIKNDWSADYELTDEGRERLQIYRERGIDKDNSRLYASVNMSFLEGLDRGESIKDIREGLLYLIPKLNTREENFPRLIEIVFHNLIVWEQVAKVDTVEDL